VARCLVTGATGFVGPHLAATLAASGHEVWTTDRGATGADRHLPCDLTDATATRALVESVRPERVFHLAGLSSVAWSFAHPQETLLANLGAACNLFEALRATAPGARVLVVGSAEQYGNVPEAEQPIPESRPFAPASPYAVSKVAQEFLALQYRAAHGLDVVLVRAFNHTGPGQSDRFVLPGFARQVAATERGLQDPVLRVGNLDVWRDFLDVRDVVGAYAALADHGASGTAYNVCRGEVFRVRDLLDELLHLSRVQLHVETDPARWRPADLAVLRGDPSRLRRATGWEPARTMAATLADVLDDWRRRLGEEEAAR
jgi:GDP-4-dehydro-6-deoxy-D-mannose reductase